MTVKPRPHSLRSKIVQSNRRKPFFYCTHGVECPCTQCTNQFLYHRHTADDKNFHTHFIFFTDDVLVAYACEHRTLEFSCGNGGVLFIRYANYGREYANICESNSNTNCRAENAQDLVRPLPSYFLLKLVYMDQMMERNCSQLAQLHLYKCMLIQQRSIQIKP